MPEAVGASDLIDFDMRSCSPVKRVILFLSLFLFKSSAAHGRRGEEEIEQPFQVLKGTRPCPCLHNKQPTRPKSSAAEWPVLLQSLIPSLDWLSAACQPGKRFASLARHSPFIPSTSSLSSPLSPKPSRTQVSHILGVFAGLAPCLRPIPSQTSSKSRTRPPPMADYNYGGSDEENGEIRRLKADVVRAAKPSTPARPGGPC